MTSIVQVPVQDPDSTNIVKQPLETLREEFGFQSFREGQLEVITSILRGRDTCVFFATASGKSLCYMLPALHTKKLVVVISPLLSLIADQIKNINDRFHRQVAVSMASTDVTPDALKQIERGESLILYVTPESMQNTTFLQTLLRIHENVREIALLAVDEAHFVAQQGFDFRQSFRKISDFRIVFPQIPMMALTATAPDHIRKDIIAALGMRMPQVYTSSYDKPNLSIHIHKHNKKFAMDEIVRTCCKPFDGSWIVYTYTRKDAEHLHTLITQKAKTREAQAAALYHGQVPYERRQQIQNMFNSGDTRLVVATGSSFGVGLDRPDIRQIIVFSLPKTFEDWYQMIGRASRDGNKGNVICYFSKGDVFMHLQRTKATNKTHLAMQKQEKNSLFALLKLYQDTQTCRRLRMLQYWGQTASSYMCGKAKPPKTLF